MSIEETVMVVGAGQMGSGIAQVFAQSGYTVLLHDTEEEQIHRAISSMTKQLTKRAEKGKLAHQAVRDITQRLAVSTDLKDVQQTHLVIEAASEQMKIKNKSLKPSIILHLMTRYLRQIRLPCRSQN